MNNAVYVAGAGPRVTNVMKVLTDAFSVQLEAASREVPVRI